jgi:hypothetical protein
MGLPDPKVQRLVTRLDCQSATMARMLDDLLDASRIALDKVSVQIEEIDFFKLLCDPSGRFFEAFFQQEQTIGRSGGGLGLGLGDQQTRSL